MPDFVLDDNGHWVENNEVFMFPGYVLDDNGHWINNEKELLKEQEAVKPEVDYICGNIVNVCGNCKSNLIVRVNFCPWCGKLVAWK